MKYFQMTYFVAVCRCKTISKAAEDMYVSQPAISAAIKELEDEFGVKLFRRQGNTLALTEAGQEFLISCQEIVGKTDELRERMQQHGNSSVLIKLGAPPMIATLIFPQLYVELAAHYPKIQLEIYEQGSVVCRKTVSEGSTDIAFAIVDNFVDSTIDKETVLNTELVYCVGKSHRFVGLKNITWDMLADERIVMMKDDSYQYYQLKEVFSSYNLSPDCLLHSSQLATIKKFVYGGLAGAFFFADVAKQDDNIVAIPVVDPIKAEIAVLWKKSSRQLDNIQLILNVARQLFA